MSMIFRILLILILSVVANLTWSLGQDMDGAVTYFVFPALLAILVAFFGVPRLGHARCWLFLDFYCSQRFVGIFLLCTPAGSLF